MSKQHQAFSLIELIFVMIIVGIVVSVSTTAILQLYQNHTTQQRLNTLSFKLQQGANQIQNRLTHAIPHTIKITANTIEWVGADYDSFSTTSTPLWSGYCDINATLHPYATAIHTPGSHLTKLNTILHNLSNKKRSISHTTLFFYGNPKAYPIKEIQDDTTLILTSPLTKGDKISPHYHFAWSAYRISPQKTPSAIPFNLYLTYNYQPWHPKGDHYKQQTLLLTHVADFKILQTPDRLTFKLCLADKETHPHITSCQERVIPL